LIDWQLEALNFAGIENKNIAIVTGYKNILLDKYNIKQFHNAEWASTNMVFSLTHAKEWLDLDNCIISYSDILYKYTAITSLMENTDQLAITYDKNWLRLWGKRFLNPLDDAESFQLNPDGTLKNIGDPVPSVKNIEGQYMGLLKITPTGWRNVARVLDSMELDLYKNLSMTSLLKNLIYNKVLKIKALPYDDYWGEIDSESDLFLFNNDPELKINQ